MVTGLIAALAIAFAPPSARCRVAWIPSAAELVAQASVIVHARATAVAVPAPGARPRAGYSTEGIAFRVLEVLKGTASDSSIVINGEPGAADGFNPGSVPYSRLGRPGGSNGNCSADDYRLGGEYLLLLSYREGRLTPYWAALAPTNEQVRGSSDPWIAWVREHLERLQSRL